jgi:hypothetical protein
VCALNSTKLAVSSPQFELSVELVDRRNNVHVVWADKLHICIEASFYFMTSYATPWCWEPSPEVDHNTMMERAKGEIWESRKMHP